MNSLIRLRAYSGSDSEEEKSLEERLPLPEFVGSSVKARPSEEVDEDGKIRNFPHEPGNWATYIYIPVYSLEFTDDLDPLASHFEPLGLKPVEDFHISLTKTVILRHHWIPGFISSIRNNLSGTRPFKIHLSGLKGYVNETRTRSFLSVEVTRGEDDLALVVSRLNQSLKEYNLEGVYESSSFHVSLFWCPGDRVGEIDKSIDLLPASLNNFGFAKEVTQCVCATGNKRFSFNFH